MNITINNMQGQDDKGNEFNIKSLSADLRVGPVTCQLSNDNGFFYVVFSRFSPDAEPQRTLVDRIDDLSELSVDAVFQAIRLAAIRSYNDTPVSERKPRYRQIIESGIRALRADKSKAIGGNEFISNATGMASLLFPTVKNPSARFNIVIRQAIESHKAEAEATLKGIISELSEGLSVNQDLSIDDIVDDASSVAVSKENDKVLSSDSKNASIQNSPLGDDEHLTFDNLAAAPQKNQTATAPAVQNLEDGDFQDPLAWSKQGEGNKQDPEQSDLFLGRPKTLREKVYEEQSAKYKDQFYTGEAPKVTEAELEVERVVEKDKEKEEDLSTLEFDEIINAPNFQ